MGLSDLARPGAVHLRRAHIAAIDDAQRRQQFAAELLRAGGNRKPMSPAREWSGKFPVDAAEIGFEPPYGDDHRAGHAELLLDAGKQRSHFAAISRRPRASRGGTMRPENCAKL